MQEEEQPPSSLLPGYFDIAMICRGILTEIFMEPFLLTVMRDQFPYVPNDRGRLRVWERRRNPKLEWAISLAPSNMPNTPKLFVSLVEYVFKGKTFYQKAQRNSVGCAITLQQPGLIDVRGSNSSSSGQTKTLHLISIESKNFGTSRLFASRKMNNLSIVLRVQQLFVFMFDRPEIP